MASLAELEQWDEELYQLETTDPVIGGPNGISNKQAKTLGNRTRYLKALILNAIGDDEDFAESIANALSQKVSIQDLQKGKYVFATDTGVGNAYICNLNPAITSRTEGQVIRFKVANSNTGASTINDGIGVVPIVGGAHAALQGGELVVGGDAWVQWNSTVGSGSYVLLSSSGGAQQIQNAGKSKHSVALGQLSNTYTSNNYGTGTSLSVSLTFTAPFNGKLIVNGAVFSGGAITGLTFLSSNAIESWSYGHWASTGASVAIRNGIFLVNAGASVTITMTMTTSVSVSSTLSMMAQLIPTA